MGAVAYATVDEYLAEVEATVAPTGLGRTLTVASRRVDEMLVGAVYATDSRGMPTDPGVRDVLRAATIEQAVWMTDIGDQNGTGAASQVTSQTIGRVSWTTGSGGGGSQSGPVSRYAPEAWSVLHTAGLVPVAVCR